MLNISTFLFYTVPTVIIGSALLYGCTLNRPSATEYARRPSYAISPKEETALRRSIAAGVENHPGLSGFRLITHGDEALLIRLALIEAAERSLDLQYYSIQNDRSGKLLLEAIMNAADRGVRVRILVDDITIKKSDETWHLLDSHPHVSLRIFNPLTTADQGPLGAVGGVVNHFQRFTKRMHNKAFIVDNQVAIIGGRNLGDAYFDNNEDFNFRDVDILAAGPITEKISASFDSFWNGKEAFPIRTLITAPEADAATQLALRKTLKDHWQEVTGKGELKATPPIAAQLREDNPALIWAKVELAADSPAKVDQPTEFAHSKPMSQLAKLADGAQHEVIMVSPYFVPGDDGVNWLADMVKKGVKVRVLTNSLASTDVVAVHTGYRRYREALLEGGIELYEMKPLPGAHPRRTGRFSSASRASLHTKIFVIDRTDVIIGTMNLDPRSVQLNTEIALVIHNTQLAERLVQMFDRAAAPASSYHVIQVGSEADTELEWVTEKDGKEEHYSNDPEAGFWRRLKADLYGLLPFEDQL